MPAYDVNWLRRNVHARDKFFCAQKPINESILMITQKYKTDDTSARNFVAFIKGLPDGQGERIGPDGKKIRPSNIEHLHYKFDEEVGDWVKVQDDDIKRGS